MQAHHNEKMKELVYPPPSLASLAKWLSVCLQTKWLWVRVQLHPLLCVASKFVCTTLRQTDSSAEEKMVNY